MKKLLIWSGLLALALAPLSARAQYPDYQPRNPVGTVASPYDRYTTYQLSARYTAAMPMGDFKNYIDQASVRGFSVTGEWLLPGNLSVGAMVGYQSWTQRLPRAVYQLNDGSELSAVQTRTFTATPIQLIGKYHLAPSSAAIRPYLQLGAGGSLTENISYYGNLSDGGNGFRFAANGAVGTRILFGKNSNFGADLSVGYQHISANFDYVKTYSAMTGSVGIVYRWW